ncbi:MAG: hypothetical protein HOK80_08530, partial [Candidatus Cloacimonetes bacterium]|nr:hypothetical protein [Candidatus Cloacimonadota bacterium]
MKKSSKTINIDDVEYLRIPLKTKILTSEDDILTIIKECIIGKIEDNDIISISESPLAITQGRAIPVSELEIGWLANFLWRFV